MTTNVSTRFLDHRRRSLAGRQQRRRSVVLAAVALAAALAGTWWIATGPLLRVHEVTITGYTAPDQAQVVQAIQVGAAVGDALHLPVQRIRAELADYPWVENVAVQHDWPRGVRVKVIQATPALVAIVEGERWLVSSKGRVLGLEGTPRLALPEMAATKIKDGGWLSGEQALIVRLATALSPDVRGSIRNLHIDPSGLLVGRLGLDGPELRFGPPVNLWSKGRSLDAVLARAQTRKLAAGSAYIDFSSADAPAFGSQTTDPQASSTGGGSDPTAVETSTNG